MRAVIPAAGFGTRLLPATKSMPKEMLPLLEKPVIQYIVEEAVASGCQDIVVVTGRHKRAIEDHFDAAPELEGLLEGQGKDAFLEAVRGVGRGARFAYVRQERPLGLGHAVLQAAPFVRDAPFAVLLGDDVMEDSVPPMQRLREAHERTGATVLSVQRVPRQQLSRYGVVAVEEARDGLLRVVDIVEKPDPQEAPSDLAAVGRYIFTPAILDHLERTAPGRGGEVQLTDAIRALLREEEVYCLPFTGTRHDAGSLTGWLEATLRLARRRRDLWPLVEGLVAELGDRDADDRGDQGDGDLRQGDGE